MSNKKLIPLDLSAVAEHCEDPIFVGYLDQQKELCRLSKIANDLNGVVDFLTSIEANNEENAISFVKHLISKDVNSWKSKIVEEVIKSNNTGDHVKDTLFIIEIKQQIDLFNYSGEEVTENDRKYLLYENGRFGIDNQKVAEDHEVWLKGETLQCHNDLIELVSAINKSMKWIEGVYPLRRLFTIVIMNMRGLNADNRFVTLKRMSKATKHPW